MTPAKSHLIFALATLLITTDALAGPGDASQANDVIQSLAGKAPDTKMLEELKSLSININDPDLKKHLLSIRALGYQVLKINNSSMAKQANTALADLKAVYPTMPQQEFIEMIKGYMFDACADCASTGLKECAKCKGTRVCDQCESRGYVVRNRLNGGWNASDCALCKITNCDQCSNRGWYIDIYRRPQDCTKCSSTCQECDENGRSPHIKCRTCNGEGSSYSATKLQGEYASMLAKPLDKLVAKAQAAQLSAPVTIELTNKDILKADFQNEVIRIDTAIGIREIPVGKIAQVDMAPFSSKGHVIKTTDNQTISGAILDDSFPLKLPGEGTVTVPINKIQKVNFD
jgi:hypothetical protein